MAAECNTVANHPGCACGGGGESERNVCLFKCLALASMYMNISAIESTVFLLVCDRSITTGKLREREVERRKENCSLINVELPHFIGKENF